MGSSFSAEGLVERAEALASALFLASAYAMRLSTSCGGNGRDGSKSGPKPGNPLPSPKRRNRSLSAACCASVEPRVTSVSLLPVLRPIRLRWEAGDDTLDGDEEEMALAASAEENDRPIAVAMSPSRMKTNVP